MSDWYDRQGKPLVTHKLEDDPIAFKNDMAHVDKLLGDRDYKVVKQEFTPDKKYWVSTVWLGLDHSFGALFSPEDGLSNPAPVIFETMVFSGRKDSWYKMGGKRHYHKKDHEQQRYTTEEEALKGHKRMMAKYTRKERK